MTTSKIHATSLDEFSTIRLIGTGTFGKVTVMTHKATKTIIALKVGLSFPSVH